MGLLLSYFRRPKDAVTELEAIEANLGRLEIWRQSQLRLQNRLLGYLLITFLLGYPTTLAVYYAYCMPVSSLLLQVAHVAAFVAALPLFYCFRRFLFWLFVRSLESCETRARQLREDKQRVLDRVMDTETYKRAKEILDRFDPDRFKAEFQQQPNQVKPGDFFSKSPISRRQPQLQQKPLPAACCTTPPLPHQQQHQQSQNHQQPAGVVLRQLSTVPSSPMQQQQLQQPPRFPTLSPQQLQARQLPRPVLSREPSTMDRILEMLVGDGADRRYALICRRCCGHNGMALAEEFPFLAWRCAYCTLLHHPRQQRLTAPPLTMAQSIPLLSQHQSPPLPGQQPQPPLHNHQRKPQWQSLIDLRPQSTDTATAADDTCGTQSLRSASSSSSSSSASTPLAAAPPSLETANRTAAAAAAMNA